MMDAKRAARTIDKEVAVVARVRIWMQLIGGVCTVPRAGVRPEPAGLFAVARAHVQASCGRTGSRVLGGCRRIRFD